jgi:hypothetical protein
MGHVQNAPSGARGLSFSIADLILAAAWAEALDLHMVVRLDHGSETEEYEEVLEFHTVSGQPSRYIVWRDATAVFVQPLIGRARRYRSVVDTIVALTPRNDDVLTDVMAPRWPDRGKPR